MWRTYTGVDNGIIIGIPTNFFNLNLYFDENSILLISQTLMEDNDGTISPPYITELISVTYSKNGYLINMPLATIDNDICTNYENKSSTLKFLTYYLGRFKR